MTDITIKNFQSIGKVDFKVEGFTVICGKNNIGKSAVMRAIGCALTNQVGSSFIRKGTKSTEITIKREGLDLLWKKGSTAEYIINGEPFTKLNRALPQPLIDAGFKRVEIGDLKIYPLLVNQFDEIFLLDKPGSTVTDALSAIYNLDTISNADVLCQKALRGVKSTLKTREGDLKDLEGQLERYSDFDSLKKEVSKLSKLEKTCDTLEIEIKEIEDYHHRVDELKDVIKTMEGIAKIKLPNFSLTAEMLEDFKWVDDKSKEFSKTKGVVEELSSLSDIKIPGVSGLDECLKEDEIISRLTSELKEVAGSLKKQGAILSVLSNLPNSEIYESSIKDLDIVENLNESFIKMAQEAKVLRQQIQDTEKEIEEIKSEMPDICPLCGK